MEEIFYLMICILLVQFLGTFVKIVMTVANASVVNCTFNNNKGFGILSELTYMTLVNTSFIKQNNDKAGNHASCAHCLSDTAHFGIYIIKNITFSECVTDDFGVMNVPNVIVTNQFTDEFKYNCDEFCIPVTECPQISVEIYLQGSLIWLDAISLTWLLASFQHLQEN